jgi:hypothetical protein
MILILLSSGCSSLGMSKKTDSFCGWATPVVLSTDEMDNLANNHQDLLRWIVNYDEHYKNLCDRG